MTGFQQRNGICYKTKVSVQVFLAVRPPEKPSVRPDRWGLSVSVLRMPSSLSPEGAGAAEPRAS